MGNLRPRYNDKARGRVAGQSQQPKKRKYDALDETNGEIIDRTASARPASQPERTEGLGKASAKKRRRLDNYIAKKLKQERRAELLKELECVFSLPLPSSILCNG